MGQVLSSSIFVEIKQAICTLLLNLRNKCMLLDDIDNDNDLGNGNVQRERGNIQRLKAKDKIGPIRTSQYHLRPDWPQIAWA